MALLVMEISPPQEDYRYGIELIISIFYSSTLHSSCTQNLPHKSPPPPPPEKEEKSLKIYKRLYTDKNSSLFTLIVKWASSQLQKNTPTKNIEFKPNEKKKKIKNRKRCENSTNTTIKRLKLNPTQHPNPQKHNRTDDTDTNFRHTFYLSSPYKMYYPFRCTYISGGTATHTVL